MTENYEEPTFDYKPLDIDNIRAHIDTYDSIKLAEMIVCDRYFGCYRDIAVLCMQELAHRRTNGDIFNFEEYIDQSFQKLPTLNLGSFNIRDIMSQAMGKVGKK